MSRYDVTATVICMIQLATRDVEKIVALVFHVPEADTLALRARLENLRKKGCPSGLVTGRGKVAKFDFGQLTDVTVALALIDAGLSPDYAVSAIEDTEGVVRKGFALLARQRPSADELRAALDEGEWSAERTVTAMCCVHRLLSHPHGGAVREATWVAFDLNGGVPLADAEISAVHINMGTLFIRLVSAIAEVSGEDRVALAYNLLVRAEEYGGHP